MATLDGKALECRKRKKVSEAEKMASELSKLASELSKATGMSARHESHVKFDRNKISFQRSNACTLDAPACKWNQIGHRPCYCSAADFKFEANLPDREYLTRYSVSCSRCFADKESVFHLYCSYCDEVLTGSIAGPGGKISDHVVTIRHVVKEAKAQLLRFERLGPFSEEQRGKAQRYLNTLDQWASTIRFKRNSEEKREIDELFLALRSQIMKRPESAVILAGVQAGPNQSHATIDMDVKIQRRDQPAWSGNQAHNQQPRTSAGFSDFGGFDSSVYQPFTAFTDQRCFSQPAGFGASKECSPQEFSLHLAREAQRCRENFASEVKPHPELDQKHQEMLRLGEQMRLWHAEMERRQLEIMMREQDLRRREAEIALRTHTIDSDSGVISAAAAAAAAAAALSALKASAVSCNGRAQMADLDLAVGAEALMCRGAAGENKMDLDHLVGQPRVSR